MATMGQIAVVTGANGSVGSNLVAELARHGYAVRGLVRAGSDRSQLEGLECELAETDYADATKLSGLCRGASCVYHLAAKVTDSGNEADFTRDNVELTQVVAEAARAAGVPRFVFASSAVLYGCSSRRNLAECDAAEELQFPYSRSKRAAEQYLLGLKGIEVVIVRAGDVYGPRDRVVTAPLLDALRRGWFPCVGSGRTTMCYTYVENLTQGLRLAGEKGRPGEIYNIADGSELSLVEIIRAMAEAAGRRVRLLHVPYFIG